MIDAKKLREERKKRIAARRAAAAPNVESAFNYNPLVQKPTTLGPGPKSGFHYFGPPPDAGTTYGMYTDNQGNGVIAPIPVKAVAPEVPTNPDAPVPAEEQPVLPAEEELELQPAEGVEVPPTVGPEATGDAAPVDPQAKPPEVPLADEMKGEGEEMIELPKSPATGEEMELMEPVAEEVKDTLIKSSKVMASLPKCPKCGFASVTSADLKKPFEKMCCTACGEDMKPLMTSEEAPVVAPTPVEPPPVTSQGPCVKCGKEPCACPAPAAAEPPVAPVAPAPVPQAEGVQYEVLQKVEAFADLTEADVHMTVFDEESANPYWNIDFRGAPVARVYLKDQPKPEEIRNTFTSAAYAEGVMGAIAKIGAHPVLKQIKAHLWSNEVNKADLAKSITASVEAKLAEAQKVKTTDLTNKLLANIQIVCAGMDKNFYKELGNPLKEALYVQIHNAGVRDPVPVIEAAFRAGSTEYFKTVLAKAVEYLGTDAKAMNEIKKAIADSDVITEPVTEGPAEGEEELSGDPKEGGIGAGEDAPTLHARLSSASVPLALAGLTNDQAADYKVQLRNELALSRKI